MATQKLKEIGRYRILGELGRGAMGVVYKAADPVLDRPLAIKTIVIPADDADRKEYEARFTQEARAAGRLAHPSIVTIYDVGHEGEMVYMTMELLEGTDLASMAWDAQASDHGRRKHKSGRIQRECRSRTDQRDQPAHDCRSKDLNQPTGRPADRIGGKALLLGSEHRDNGLHGRVEEGVPRGHPRGHEIGVPGALRPQQRQGEHRSEQVGSDQHRLATEPIDDHARDRAQYQHGHNLSGDQASHRQTPACELEDQDHEGDVVQRVAETRRELAEPERKVGSAANHAAVGR